MTNEQKKRIAELRGKGISYAKIGEALGISGDTVKTYCRRNHITVKQESPATCTAPTFCKECGAPLGEVAVVRRAFVQIFLSALCSIEFRVILFGYLHKPAVERQEQLVRI